MIRDNLERSLRAALEDLQVAVGPAAIDLERPARREHGDWSSNVALVAAKAAGRRPRELAAEIAAHLSSVLPEHVSAVEVAGPGFVNFHLEPSWLHAVLSEVVTSGVSGYARHDVGRGGRVQVEFVSANPTGPLHVGNGWFASYGDAVARLLERCGWAPWREYYVNDTGGQVRRLGESLLARRRGEAVAEDGYQGQYVSELAARYEGSDDVVEAGAFAVERILAGIRETLAGLNIVFDDWFSQASIEESGAVEETIELLDRQGAVFEQDGALWLRSTAFGDTRDRVLRKSEENGGDYTYLAGDLAYHRNKFLLRGFERVIDVFGADHHGQVASLRAGVQALGVEPDRLEVRLGQMVSLVSGRMSKRSGNYVPLDELVGELGPDVTRLLSLVSSIDQATTLDLDAVRGQSRESPVFYVQYAHARIASMGRVAADRGIDRLPLSEVDLGLLVNERELELLRSLSELPEVVLDACRERAPHKICAWVREMADRFHGFYHDCWVMGADIPAELTQARLWIVEASRIGLAIGLDLLGVSAPELM
ncbi:MAG: arginine--tRNA ligase [Acidimicrobiales bacterium]